MFLLLDAKTLETTRQCVASGDPQLAGAMEKLCTEADKALASGPWSVMDKKLVPPSGDKHDYMSVGPYWWPNPDTPNGLPYVWRDGEENPAYYESDGGSLRAMAPCLDTLCLTYHLTGDERYAAHASKILRTWFLAEDTHMNPHMRYAQAIPGQCEGRSIGLVDATHLFPTFPDNIAMIRSSQSWTEQDEAAMKAWFREFLDWMLTSEFGQKERAERQNHGTWCDITLGVLALYTGQIETARSVLEAVPTKILDDQLEPDGKQPHELWRTRSFFYSTLNLDGLFQLATLAEHLGTNLWNYKTKEGGSIRKAIEWMAQYAHPDTTWPYQEIGTKTLRPVLYSLLHRAYLKYNEPQFQQTLQQIPPDEWKNDRFQLLWGAVKDSRS